MDPTDVINLIRARAAAYGIDPNVALQVARSEGLNSYVGDKGSSFGPFQLHYGGVAPGGNSVPGLGDVFTKQTGLNARDPSTVPQQVDFALNYASQHGWGPWHGWQGTRYAGINSPPLTPGTQAPPLPPPINVGSLPIPQAQAPQFPAAPQQQQQQDQQKQQPQFAGGGQAQQDQGMAMLAQLMQQAPQLRIPQPFRPQVNLAPLQQVLAQYQQQPQANSSPLQDQAMQRMMFGLLG